MAESAQKERSNKVKISDAGPSRKKIAIEIPAETVAEQLGTSLDTLLTEADIPGFRRGRAPKRLVEKKFGSVVRREAKNQLVATAYQSAIEDSKLRVLGEPIGEGLEKVEIKDGEPLAFEVEVEVLPEFDLPELSGIAVKKPLVEVTDERVEEEIKKLGLHEGELEQQEKPARGDYLTGRGVMKGEGDKVILDIADAVIQIPPKGTEKGMILGIMVEEFAGQVGLPVAGETITVSTVGPENHENEDVRGTDLKIDFTVSRVDRIIPAPIEKLVERFGLSDEAALREAMKERMSERVGIEQQTVQRQQVANHLLKHVEMELPQRVTAVQAQRNLARRRLDLMHRGIDAQSIEEHMAELRAASAGAAVRELKLFFILDKAAEKLDVKVTEGELNGRIAQMAFSRGERPDKLRQELIQSNQIGMVYQQIREHKTLDAILAKATVSDVPAEEFAKLMAEETGVAEGKKAGKSKAKAEEAKSDESDEGETEKKPAKKGGKKKE